jgi:hypothetical protein
MFETQVIFLFHCFADPSIQSTDSILPYIFSLTQSITKNKHLNNLHNQIKLHYNHKISLFISYLTRGNDKIKVRERDKISRLLFLRKKKTLPRDNQRGGFCLFYPQK